MVHPDGSVITFIGNFLVAEAETVVNYLEEEIAKNHPLLRKATVEEYTVALADPLSPLVEEKEKVAPSEEEVVKEKEQPVLKIPQQVTTFVGSSPPADPFISSGGVGRSSTVSGGSSL